MTFGSIFGRVFSPTFQPKSQAAAASSWWLAGGIDPANCVAAYQPKGAASLAASLLNLNNPGTRDAQNIGGTWNATGWYGSSTTGFQMTNTPEIGQNSSCFVKYQVPFASFDYVIPFQRATVRQNIGVRSDGYGHLYNIKGGYGSWFGAMSGFTDYVVGFAGRVFYKNGSPIVTVAEDTSTTTTSQMTIANYRSRVACFVYYNTVITPTQIGLLTTAMAAL